MAEVKTTATAGSEAACWMLHKDHQPMPVVCEFTSMGEPVPKARARTTSHGSFTPERTKTAQELMAFNCITSTRGLKVSDVDRFGVFAIFFCGTRQRRDIDNLSKLVLDALTGIVWKDDVQVVEMSLRRVFVDDEPEHARTEVMVYRVTTAQTIQQFKSCEHCGKDIRVYNCTKSRKFCSQQCAHAAKTKDRECPTCGSTFKRPPGGSSKFCSPECGREGKRTDVPCSVCGAATTVTRSVITKGQSVFCSDVCRREYWRPKQAKRATGVCSECGGPTSKKTYKRCGRCAAGFGPSRIIERNT